MRRDRRCQDEGFSLVELLVVIILMGIVGTVITNSVVSATRAARTQDDETRTLVTAKIAMERITREIRGANALVMCQPRTMSFTMTRNNIRTAITFRVDTASATSSEINEAKTTTDLATGVSTTTTTKVLGGLAIGASDAVFSYADADGATLTPESLSPESYNPGAAKTVGVKVLMRRINGSPSVQLYQLVSIRNFEV
jgi:prepilin-type N-terminal cleavage/methylation domain-containing protein